MGVSTIVTGTNTATNIEKATNKDTNTATPTATSSSDSASGGADKVGIDKVNIESHWIVAVQKRTS